MGFLFGLVLFCFFLATPHSARGILVPQPGMEPTPPAVEAQSLNHWTARVVPGRLILSQCPQSVSQMGPQRPREGQGLTRGHKATPQASPLQYLKEATSEWDQEDCRVRPAPISLESQGKGSDYRAPSCLTPCRLCLGFHSCSGPHTWGPLGQVCKPVDKASSVCTAGKKGAAGESQV